MTSILRQAREAERREISWVRATRGRIANLERRLAQAQATAGGFGGLGTTPGEVAMIAHELAGVRREMARAVDEAASAGRVRRLVEGCR